MKASFITLILRSKLAAAWLFPLLALPTLLAPLHSGVAQEDSAAQAEGLRIAEEASQRGKGFGNFSAKIVMTLRQKGGRESVRAMRTKVLEVEGDGNRSIFVFDQPRDVRGTALLIHAHPDDANEQWLFLPALSRVKRISSSNRSGSFMASEFSYEDLGEPEVPKYTYRYLRDEPCGELSCTVTEWIPVERESGYTRQEVWHDKDEYRIMKVQYYDRKKSHLKTLEMSDYQKYAGSFWQAGTMDMQNHQTGKSTTMQWSEFVYGGDLNENDFTQTGLRRVR